MENNMIKTIDNLPILKKNQLATEMSPQKLISNLKNELKKYLGDVKTINFYAIEYVKENEKCFYWYGDNVIEFIKNAKQLNCPVLFATYSKNIEDIVDFEDFEIFDDKNIEKANTVWIADIGVKDKPICVLPEFGMLWYLFES